MARPRRNILVLASVAGIGLLLAGCEPPRIPTAGGLVPANPPQSAPGLELVTSSGESTDELPATTIAEPLPPAPGENPAVAASAPPPPSIPIVANPDLIPVDVASSRGAPPLGQQPVGSQPPANSRGVPAIRLSAGIAVPQSLPIGTVMGMSVDYQIAGPLNQSSQYVWVVSSQGGGSVEAALPLQGKGTLQAFFSQLRPEHRPFHCHIDEVSPSGRRTRVSNVATMQTNY